jgi:hypothetical protein
VELIIRNTGKHYANCFSCLLVLSTGITTRRPLTTTGSREAVVVVVVVVAGVAAVVLLAESPLAAVLVRSFGESPDAISAADGGRRIGEESVTNVQNETQQL